MQNTCEKNEYPYWIQPTSIGLLTKWDAFLEQLFDNMPADHWRVYESHLSSVLKESRRLYHESVGIDELEFGVEADDEEPVQYNDQVDQEGEADDFDEVSMCSQDSLANAPVVLPDEAGETEEEQTAAMIVEWSQDSTASAGSSRTEDTSNSCGAQMRAAWAHYSENHTSAMITDVLPLVGGTRKKKKQQRRRARITKSNGSIFSRPQTADPVPAHRFVYFKNNAYYSLSSASESAAVQANRLNCASFESGGDKPQFWTSYIPGQYTTAHAINSRVSCSVVNISDKPLVIGFLASTIDPTGVDPTTFPQKCEGKNGTVKMLSPKGGMDRLTANFRFTMVGIVGTRAPLYDDNYATVGSADPADKIWFSFGCWTLDGTPVGDGVQFRVSYHTLWKLYGDRKSVV